MIISQNYPSSKSFSIKPNDVSLGSKILTTNLSLQSTEKLVVVTDIQMENNEGALWFESAKTITPNVCMIVLEGMTTNGEEPPPEVAEIMRQSDVAILQTSFSLTHTDARRRACQAKTRVASLPNADISLLRRTLSADYRPIQIKCQQLIKLLKGKSTAIITSPAGTNITMSIENMRAEADDGFIINPGSYGNLPAGETMLAPVEGSANGVFVVEGSFATIPTDTPITVRVENGKAISITGGKAANQLNDAVNRIGDKARNIAELGIGANPEANPNGKVIEAEKADGTVHIALGNNLSYGGTVDVPFHSDGIILQPTLIIDNQIIIENGKFKG